ncbi:hypothetical protein SDC9_106461 [bioreactor metagenome]|uniref:Uncharacterized protein n=1 Tax=bioreactor metagenome TaxID=1076179 RepID=A0A645B3G1_9ZZZZ
MALGGENLCKALFVWPIVDMERPIAILYAGRDNMTSRQTVEGFVTVRDAALTVMENGEHLVLHAGVTGCAESVGTGEYLKHSIFSGEELFAETGVGGSIGNGSALRSQTSSGQEHY